MYSHDSNLLTQAMGWMTLLVLVHLAQAFDQPRRDLIDCHETYKV
jgi:hypothetical protein